jgi:hypothetical protein
MRAIDRHEDAITYVLDLLDDEQVRELGVTYDAALEWALVHHPELTKDRLDHLVRVWCAIAGDWTNRYDLRRKP